MRFDHNRREFITLAKSFYPGAAFRIVRTRLRQASSENSISSGLPAALSVASELPPECPLGKRSKKAMRIQRVCCNTGLEAPRSCLPAFRTSAYKPAVTLNLGVVDVEALGGWGSIEIGGSTPGKANACFRPNVAIALRYWDAAKSCFG
jgi:hypothetical protein